MSRQNIYLIGFMGSGKSTIGKILATSAGMNLVEMDERIVQKAGMSINDIFETLGEPKFRDMETELLRTLGKEGNTVVSCGGGVPMRQTNVDIMQGDGIVVYLETSPEEIFRRVKNSTDRPLLNGHMNLAYIEELMETRRPKYEAAANAVIRTDGKSKTGISREILELC